MTNDAAQADPSPTPLPFPGEPEPAAQRSEREPQQMSRWLWFAYPLANAAIAVAWGAALQQLLARQVAAFTDDAPSTSAGVLGLVVSAAAVFGLIAAPVLGTLSDRTRVRFLGRRNSWILGSALVSAVALVATALAPDALTLGIIWCLAVWPLNGFQATIGAVLPERVPVRVRGTMSGIAGTVGLLGTFVGVAIGSAGVSPAPLVGYVAAAAVLVVVGALFAFTTKDVPAPQRTVDRPKVPLPTFRTQPDFWWAFIGRFLTFFGYFLVTGMLVFILRDYIQVGDGSTAAASSAVVLVSGLSTLFIMVASFLGGFLADRFKRLKLFVVVSSLVFVPGAIIAMVVPTLGGLTVAMCVAGLGFGSYLAVDQALISRVISDVEVAGRDLGIFSVANAAPQIVTPVLGGALLTGLGAPSLFVGVIVFSVLGAVAILRIKRVS